MKAVLINNQLSRYNQRYPNHVDAIAQLNGLTSFNLDADMLRNAAQIDAMLKEVANTGAEILCINGGDGTLDLILTHLQREAFSSWNPRILLLRGGTTNMTHRDVGFGKDPAKALRSAIACHFELSVIKRHMIRVDNADMTSPYYGFFFGTHALPRAISHTRLHLHSKGNHGVMSEVRMLISTLGALLCGKVAHHPILSPTSLSFSYQGTMREAMHVTFIATTLERLLLNLALSKPRNQIGFLILKEPYTNIAPALASLWTGEPDRDHGSILRFRDDEIRIAFDGEYTIDGEIFNASSNSYINITKADAVSFLK